MKKILYLTLALSFTGIFAACSGKQKADTSDTATEVEATQPAEVEVDSVAARFRNPDLKSEVATDSTYVETPSGLKYMVKKAGTGAKPGPEDVVKVHYTGKLVDGTVFDSSVARGEPISFPLQGVIAGWTEGLQYMQEGATYVFYIPTDLAYGAHGAPGAVPPFADLVFEVELIKVNPDE